VTAVVARYSLFIMQYATELDLVIASYDFSVESSTCRNRRECNRY